MNRRLSVSSWSLHHALGSMPITGPADEPNTASPPNALPLLDLPRAIGEHGISTLEICHFHLPSTEGDYLARLRASLEESGVELWSLLVDGGDLNGAHAARDFDWIARWFGVAEDLGAHNVRVIAGQGAPTEGNLAQSISMLKELAATAGRCGVRLMTENWFATLSTPADVHHLFSQLDGQLDLCLDFGNWDDHPDKCVDLASIAHYATSCHARADFRSPGELDEADFRRCLELTVGAGFHGPYTLIPSGAKGDEWQALDIAANAARPFCEATP